MKNINIKKRILLSIPLFIMISFVYLYYLIYFKNIHKEQELHSQKFNKDNFSLYYLVPVLLFHNIDGKGPYSVSREEFRNYLSILKQERINIIDLQTLYKHALNNTFFNEPTMVITVDDDYTNIVRVLAPMLREFQFPATFFFYVKDINNYAEKGTSWEDLQRLLNEGFDIQNHSYSHTIFHKKSPLETEEEYNNKLYREIILSKKILEEKLKTNIWAFAYPMGFYTENLNQYIFENGYKIVLTTDGVPLDLSKKFNGIIHRYTVQKEYVKDPMKMFYLQISYAKKIYKSSNISLQ